MQFRSSRRGYNLTLERDLLGDFVLIRHWFGLTNRRHGEMRQVFLNEEDALDELENVAKQRIRNGYHFVTD